MSEQSLEDFFAKKDKSKKSKSKGKTKFTTTNEIAKKITEGEKKAAKKQDKKEKEKKPEKPSTDTVDTDQPKTAYQVAGEKEWNDFEDPSEKDYSGLKVQSLQISAEPEEVAEEEEEGEVELDENGDVIKRKDGAASGPWNKQTATATAAAASPSEPEAPPPEVKPEPPKPKPATTGRYVPPSRRAAAAMGTGDSSTPSRNQQRRGGKHVPQIESDLEFPSLAASSDIAKYSDKNADKNFQEVRKGGQATDNPSGQRHQLEVQNRYAALGGN